MEVETSFTQVIKEEICDLPYEKEQALSILSAFIRLNGALVFNSDGSKLTLKTESSKTAKYIYSLIKESFQDVEVSFTFRKMMRFNKSTQYLINVVNNIEEILKILEIDFLESKIPYSLTNKENKIKGYFAGLFLGSGSCSNPKSSNYHLEVYTNNEDFSLAILKLINKIKDVEFGFKIIKRRNDYVVYLKKSDQISDFLAYIGAYNACLLFEDVRVNRDFSNVSNRLINMDAHNYKKTIDNSKLQIEQIRKIDRMLGIKNISNTKLRELCYLRLKNPEATYNDLATLLSDKLEVSVSKSNINHLFIKVREMAKGGNDEDTK